MTVSPESPFFYDQTVMNDIAEEDIDLNNVTAQEMWRTYVNDLGPSAEVTLQVADIEDFELVDQAADMFEEAEGDTTFNELIVQEFQADERAVPYEFRYWEHSPDEFPEVDESNAPPMPPGWVDPDTDEMVT